MLACWPLPLTTRSILPDSWLIFEYRVSFCPKEFTPVFSTTDVMLSAFWVTLEYSVSFWPREFTPVLFTRLVMSVAVCWI